MAEGKSSHTVRVLAWPWRGKEGNPYTRLLYSGLQGLGVRVEEFTPTRLVSGAYDVWHIHWPDGLFNRENLLLAARGGLALVVLLEIARLKGIRVVWTGHNAGSHRDIHPWLSRRMWTWFVSRLDGLISLSEAGIQALCRRFPALSQKPHFVIYHGHFRGAYPDNVSRLEARRRLGLPDNGTVITHFGRIRSYKNVDWLIEVVRAVDRRDLRLLVAGAADKNVGRELELLARPDDRVHLHLRYIPDENVQLYFRAADLAILPYQHILHSGTAILALSFDCPVLVPDRGAMKELRDTVGSEWIHLFDSPLSVGALREAIAWAAEIDREKMEFPASMDWESVARLTLAAYQRILRG